VFFELLININNTKHTKHNMSVEVYLATENTLIVWCPDTQYLVKVENTPELSKYPTEGLLELTRIFVYSVEQANTTTPMKLMQQILSLELNTNIVAECAWSHAATNYRDLDSATFDCDIENHLMIQQPDEDERIINTIDYINEEGLYAVGAYQYETQFQKMITTDTCQEV
jgi:hypothetical protein